MQTDSDKFWAQVFKILVVVFFQAVSQIIKEWLKMILTEKTMMNVHNDVLKSIINAPVNLFFDVTPNGSIMKRFTEDMGVVEDIVHCFMGCICVSIEIAYMFVLICYQNLAALVVVPILFGYAKYIWNYTNKGKRQAIQLLEQ